MEDKEKKENPNSNIIEMDAEEFQKKVAIAQQQQAVKDQKILDLLSGKREAPNKFVRYLVDRLKTCKEEFVVVQKNLRELTVRIQQLRQRESELKGEHDKYIGDIREWDKPEGEDQ